MSRVKKQYEIRPGSRGFRGLHFFDVFDEKGQVIYTGGATTFQAAVEAAREAIHRTKENQDAR